MQAVKFCGGGAVPQAQPGRVLTLAIGHLVNDMYMNQIQVLLPFFVASGLAVSKGAFLISVFTLTSSLVQPFFGLLSDRANARWLVCAGTLWMAAFLGLIGWVAGYGKMVALVAMAGLGTAAFHPQASALVAACGGQRKAFAQAVFIAAGNVGWSLTPLLVVPLVQAWGMRVTPVFIVPGALASLALWRATRGIPLPPRKSASAMLPALRHTWGELARLMLVVAFRSMTYFGLISFIPLYLRHKDIPLGASSRLVFLMLFAGSLGGLAGGYLADRIGRKPVIVISLLTCCPVLYLFLHTTGPASTVCLGLAGALLLASFSVTVAAAHQVISQNAGLASGLMLGFGVGIGGLGVGLMGVLVDHTGIVPAMKVLAGLPLLAGLLGLCLRK